MEKIGETLNSQQSNIAGTAITREPSQPPSELPEWAKLLATMAQDKRHDLETSVIRLWKGKLNSFPDAEICDALSLYRGEFFPSVDVIIELIERRRAFAAEQKQNLYWLNHKRNNRDIERYKAEHGGKTPMQVFCDENQELIRKLEVDMVSKAPVGAK